MSDKVEVTLTVNGRAHPIRVEPRRTLADAIREDCGCTGTHLGCEHGVCGACTVLVDGRAVRSCLMLAVQADGAKVVTVEGLSHDEGLIAKAEAAASASVDPADDIHASGAYRKALIGVMVERALRDAAGLKSPA